MHKMFLFPGPGTFFAWRWTSTWCIAWLCGHWRASKTGAGSVGKSGCTRHARRVKVSTACALHPPQLPTRHQSNVHQRTHTHTHTQTHASSCCLGHQEVVSPEDGGGSRHFLPAQTKSTHALLERWLTINRMPRQPLSGKALGGTLWKQLVANN